MTTFIEGAKPRSPERFECTKVWHKSRCEYTLQICLHSKHRVFSTEASDLPLIAVVARVIKFERPLRFYGVMKTHLAHKVTYQKFCTKFFSTVGCKWAGWGRASGHRAVCICFRSPAVWLAGSLPSWLVSAGRSDRQTMMTAVIGGCSSLPPIHPRTKKVARGAGAVERRTKRRGVRMEGGYVRETERRLFNPVSTVPQLLVHWSDRLSESITVMLNYIAFTP